MGRQPWWNGCGGALHSPGQHYLWLYDHFLFMSHHHRHAPSRRVRARGARRAALLLVATLGALFVPARHAGRSASAETYLGEADTASGLLPEMNLVPVNSAEVDAAAGTAHKSSAQSRRAWSSAVRIDRPDCRKMLSFGRKISVPAAIGHTTAPQASPPEKRLRPPAPPAFRSRRRL